MQIAVTGASGYLGEFLSDQFEKKGHNVLRMQRNTNDEVPPRVRHFSLDVPQSAKLDDIDLLVHCAYDFSKKSWLEIERLNITNTIFLLKRAVEAGISRIFFVSSLSAFQGCTSNYGQAKLRVERFCNQNNIYVIKPGLIVGDDLAGITGILANICKWSPLLPYPYSSNSRLSVTERSNIFQCITSRIEEEIGSGTEIIVTSNTNLKLKEALRLICAGQGIRPPVMLPIPAIFFLALLKLWQLVNPSARIGPDNLRSFLTLT
tara:strand:+ start:1080 stop:1865 length:786 start_codon:yes stop_codon:yes gene_type:complete